MKETSEQLLDQLILGEIDWHDSAVLSAMDEDLDFAMAAVELRQTVEVLQRNKKAFGPPPAQEIATEAVIPSPPKPLPQIRPSRKPLSRRALWLIPSAAALLAWVVFRGNPTPPADPGLDATLGSASQSLLPVQERNQYKSFDFGAPVEMGAYRKVRLYTAGEPRELLLESGQIREPIWYLDDEQRKQLVGHSEVRVEYTAYGPNRRAIDDGKFIWHR